MSDDRIIGRVLRASTRGFDCGTHSRDIGDWHNFGTFVKASIANQSQVIVVGLIYKVEIKDDQLISELVMGDYVPDNILRDQRDNRMIPVEVKVLSVGYWSNGRAFHSMPPRPPMSLSDVRQCTPEEVRLFTQRVDYVRLVLGASEVPSDDLVGASLRLASECHENTDTFLIEAGRQLARELSGDLKRLSHVLALLR